MNDSLLAVLKRRSYKKGTFTLASGRTSDFYIDCKQTFLTRDGLWRAAQELEAIIGHHDVVAVAGEGVGGIPLAVAVAMYSGFLNGRHRHPVIVRKGTKDHGTGNRVERARDMVPDGSRVVLVEDVLTTGGSALRAVQALREDGLDVVAVVALVDRLEGAHEAANEAGVEMRALYTRLDFVEGENSHE